MAIQKEVAFRGIPLADAYHRIECVLCRPLPPEGTVFVDVFANVEQAANLASRIDTKTYTLSIADICGITGRTPPPGVTPTAISAANMTEWLYKWLLLKPEFEGGVSV